MADLIYTSLCSLDGYNQDQSGSFDWSEPDEQVHAFINNLERPSGTYLLGRRMYDVMAVWETEPAFSAQPGVYRDYAEIWQAAEKIVYSRTLQEVRTQRTRLESTFDPQAVRELKSSARSDLSIGGPNLAAHAFKHGLVDQVRLFLAPVSVGEGKKTLPDDIRLDLELTDQRRFDNGMVYLCYRLKAL